MRLNNYPFNFLVLCLAFLCLASFSVGGGSPIENDGGNTGQVPKVFDYGSYVERFKKNYGPTETLYKAKLFFARTLKIFQHNVLYTQKKVGYFLRQNIFTDMTASELRQSHLNKEPELAPIKEAATNPNLPADRLPSVRRLKGEQDEGFSQASLDDLSNNAKYDSSTERVKPVLNFMENQNDLDMKVLLREIEEMPEVYSKIAKMVNLDEETKKISDDEASGVPKQRRVVEYTPIVESNNKNYEPQVAFSQGSARQTMENMGQNYAKFLMDDPDFAINYAPYPSQYVDDSESEKPLESKTPSLLSKVMGTVKKVANYLIDDDDDDLGAVEEPNVSDATLDVETRAAETSVKYNIDWRQTGCISPVQNQRDCDSCYAFSVLSLMEYFHCRQTHKLTSFSAQYIVDCGQRVNLNGCRGSKISNVGQFIKKYGIELNSKYPYNARENSCPYNFDDPEEEKKSGYLRPVISHWQNFQDMASWYKWLRKSPVIVGINMPADFLAYGGGVHDGLDCVDEMTHAMLLVGSGVQDGKEFWLLRNSYSEQWGEQGYFKLSKSAPLRCFNSAIVARAKFSTQPEPIH